MKNATEWLNEVGETVMFSAFVGSNPPGNEVEKLVRRIQVDTLMHAAEVCRKDDGLSILAAGKLERLAQELSGMTAQPNAALSGAERNREQS